MSLSIFLPARKDSQRAPGKNTREFAGIQGGLLELKLRELVQIKEADEILLSSNDESTLEIGEFFQKKYPVIRLDERPENLSASETDLTDLIEYAGQKVMGEDILWTHVTSPFCRAELYQESIREFYIQQENNFDSLVGVRKFQNYLWDPGRNDLINRSGARRWPRTQDLKPLFEINNAVFIAPRKIFQEQKDRLGSHPFMFEMDKIPSMDIDDEEDYKFAVAVYERIFR